MTKRDKKVIDTLKAIIKMRYYQIDRENDKQEKLNLYNQISAYKDCIYLLTNDEFLYSMLDIYKDL